MTLAEIEVLLGQLQAQIKSNTAAITTLNNTVANYATTDDLNTLAKQVNTLLVNNDTLQESVAALAESIDKVDYLSKLTDIKINNITENDVLQFGYDGKWHNVQPHLLSGLDVSNTGSATKLSDLTDVLLTSVSDGHALVYSASDSKWINKLVTTSSSGSSDCLTKADADLLYLPLTGGTITGNLTVNGTTTLNSMLTVNDNILCTKAITMFDNE